MNDDTLRTLMALAGGALLAFTLWRIHVADQRAQRQLPPPAPETRRRGAY